MEVMTQEEYYEKCKNIDRMTSDWIYAYMNLNKAFGVLDLDVAKKQAIELKRYHQTKAVNEIEKAYWRMVYDSIVFHCSNNERKPSNLG
jgi:hypothetical protein